MTDAIEREWQTVPTDLAGWAMRASQMKKERDVLREAIQETLAVAEGGYPRQGVSLEFLKHRFLPLLEWSEHGGGED